MIEWQREKPLYSGFLDNCEKFLGKFLGVCAVFLTDMMCRTSASALDGM